MTSQRRKFTVEEKMEILQQAKQSGIIAALRRHNLSYSVFHRWKEKLTDKGKDPNSRRANVPAGGRVKELLEENALLKKIIANQAMLLELKEEELRNQK
ncbi:MAG TPA: transposase [Puia sp.]|nr:transposase [Puia sp.]